MESKRAKFIRIGERRVNDVLDGLRLLSNLKSSQYDSTPQMRNEILSAIRGAMEEMEYIWSGSKPDKAKFQFKSGLPEEGDSSEDAAT